MIVGNSPKPAEFYEFLSAGIKSVQVSTPEEHFTFNGT